MMDYHRVTTTPTLEGHQIDQYLGLVAAQLVAGVGVVSEFFAGFSDLFGGRSGAYQKHLSSLYQEATVKLLKQAESRGGNWVVGARFDVGEISGKNTQLLTLSAFGTAVRARRIDRQVEQGGPSNGAFIPGREVKNAALVLNFQDEIQKGKIFLTDEELQFATDNAIEAASDLVLKGGAEREKVLAYFSSLPEQSATRILYDAIATGSAPAIAAKTLASLDLLDLARTLDLLGSPLRRTRVMALQVFEGHARHYSPGDLSVLEQLARKITVSFEPATVTATKKLIGTQKSWKCWEGHEVEGDALPCVTCGRDRQGFGLNDLRPDEVVKQVRRRAEAITELVGAEGLRPQ
jgi:uncharacterized protein YbjQ (UPF0145 family)